VAWVGSCLGVLVLAVCCFGATHLLTSHASQWGELRNEPIPLDSFSKPALACAVLKQEAELLMQAYLESRDEIAAARWLKAAGEAPSAPGSGAGQETRGLGSMGHLTGSEIPEVQSLRALDARVQDLQRDLSVSLLAVYLDHGWWSAYVDRYLQVIRESPQRDEVTHYVRSALECAGKCGRAEEVLDALQHIVRFHPELRTAGLLVEVLAEQRTDEGSD